MPTSARRRIVAAITTVASAAALFAALASSPALAATGPSSVTFAKSYQPPGNDYGNPLRGQYRWIAAPAYPAGWAAPDVYYRDQVYWGRLERTTGNYDFSSIDAGLSAAGAAKGKFGFRVMAFCPGCWMESRPEKDIWPAITPSFVPMQPGTSTPDWNSEGFLAGWERLMSALGARYANDPRLGFVDVGGYGKYGEWWVDTGTPRITDANALRLINAVNRAFPTKHVVLSTMPAGDFILKALATNPLLGLRTDCLGAPNMHSMVAVDTRLQSVWKTRPLMSEWCRTGDPALGRDQVKAYHVSTTSSGNMSLSYSAMTSTQQAAYKDAMRSSGYRYHVGKVTVGPIVRGRTTAVTTTITNRGVAPTYDSWSVQLWLVNASGQKVYAKALSAVDLRKILPGTRTSTSYISVPTTLPRGTYTATIAVVDRLKYSPNMWLAEYGRRSDGSYTLGSVHTG